MTPKFTPKEQAEKLARKEAEIKASLVAVPGSVKFQKELKEGSDHLTEKPFMGLKDALKKSA